MAVVKVNLWLSIGIPVMYCLEQGPTDKRMEGFYSYIKRPPQFHYHTERNVLRPVLRRDAVWSLTSLQIRNGLL